MKIYTKTGDKGTTALIGGERVSKAHPRVEAYGTIDELMAHVGILITCPECTPYRETLNVIQFRLMEVASILATSETAGKAADKVHQLDAHDIEEIESAIDALSNSMPQLNSFVLPGGTHFVVAYAHVARTVCRRAERRIVEIDHVPTPVHEYINRLSDYFFLLSRALARDCHDPQLRWVPR